MSTKIIATPFDQIILQLTNEKFNRLKTPDSSRNLILEQLQQLRVIYLWMKEVDFYTKATSEPMGERPVSLEELVLEDQIDYYKAYLSYFLFVTILNQLFRVIEKHFPDGKSGFPKYKRIKFYRDKVGEHWEGYTAYLQKGNTFQKGNIAIPFVENSNSPEERKQLRDKLVARFANLGVTITITENFLATGMSSMKDYSDLIYKALERLNPEFHMRGKTDKTIIELLFRFGFPAPINDVQIYSDDFVKYIQGVLNMNKLG